MDTRVSSYLINSIDRNAAEDRRSIRLWSPQHYFRGERQDQLRRDGRDARQHSLPEVALDMVFLGIAHAAVCQHRRFAGTMAGLGVETFFPRWLRRRTDGPDRTAHAARW